MRLAALALALFSNAAFAQWGIGLSPGVMCNNRYGAARPAVNGNDEIMNLSGQLAARNQQIDALKQKRGRIDEYVTRAKKDMGAVLSGDAIAAIEMHRRYGYSFNSYQQSCGARPGPAPGRGTDPEMFDDAGGRGTVNANLPPPPNGFCVQNPATGAYTNMWRKFVEDDGTVNREICDHLIAGLTKTREASAVDTCHQGMVDYYDRMAERERINDQIAKLDKEARTLERRLERIHDEITEGTYCPWCAAQRQGYTTGSGSNSIMPLIGGIAVLGLAMLAHQQQGPVPSPYMMQPAFRPQIMPYGGPGFPVNPYPAPIPGYMGMMGPPGAATYGAVPGAMGQGAFGCNGSNPLAMGNPFGSPSVMPVFGGLQSPFNNPYANPQMNPMFNGGAGPGWGFPMYGSGYPGFQNPFGNPFGSPFGSPFGNPAMMPYLGANPNGMSPFGSPFGGSQFGSPFGGSPFGSPFGASPFGSPYGMNPYAPSMLPYMGAGNPFASPFGYNPYNPLGSNPYATPFGPGFNPWGGAMSPFGPGYPYTGALMGNPYAAPAMLPYMGSNPYGSGLFGTPFGPGYGFPGGTLSGGIPNYGYGNPTGNFFSQIDYLNRQMQIIGGGSYYGGAYGGTGLSAPAMLPYLGPQPIYNTPGTGLNPLVPPSGPAMTGRPPAILPYNH